MGLMDTGWGAPDSRHREEHSDPRISALLTAARDAAATSLTVLHVPDAGAAEVLVDIAATGEEFFPHEPVTLALAAAQVVGLSSGISQHHRQLRFPQLVSTPAPQGEVYILIDAAFPPTAHLRGSLSDIARDFGRELGRESEQLHRLLHRAAVDLAQAAASQLDAREVMDVMLEQARNFLRADVSYLSRPADDTVFQIEHTHGIRTRQFQNLRVPSGDALGGKAAQDRVPVISHNYLEDPHLLNAKLVETRDEGIISALAVPVFNDTQVEGVLYVGNRAHRGYTPRDAALLTGFAELSLVPLRRFHLDEQQRERIITAERSGLARRLHDTVVRELTQLTQQSTGRSPEYSQALESGVSAIREEIRRLTEPDTTPAPAGHNAMSAADILNAIVAVPGAGLLHRNTHPGTGGLTGHEFPGRVAEALIAVGQEAVSNAELHSEGQNCTIILAESQETWELKITDDGRGMTDVKAHNHFGLVFMKTVMASVGGALHIASTPGSGTEVVATWKVGPDEHRSE